MMRRTYKPGDPVVLQVTKQSKRPSLHVHDLRPMPHGETYHSQKETFGVVAEALADSMLIVRTHRGITHAVSPDEPNLRHATWWERLWHQDWFPQRVR